MPTAKTKITRETRSIRSKKVEASMEPTYSEISETSGNPRRRKFFILVLIIGLLLLAYYKKGWFVAALVNNQPITNLELQQRLNQLYKDKVLSQMINEKILEQEATKKGIVISQKEIDDKITETEKQYGGKDTFESLLSQQGLTRAEFARQTRFQLIVEKLFEKEASPTTEEIQKFMDENKSVPEATDEAKFRNIAEKSVRQDKLSKIFSEKFQQLKTSAKIQIF